MDKHQEEYNQYTAEDIKRKNQSIKDIDKRVLDIIDILQDINKQYASWDMWDKTEIIDKSLNILKDGYKEELEKKFI